MVSAERGVIIEISTGGVGTNLWKMYVDGAKQTLKLGQSVNHRISLLDNLQETMNNKGLNRQVKRLPVSIFPSANSGSWCKSPKMMTNPILFSGHFDGQNATLERLELSNCKGLKVNIYVQVFCLPVIF